MSAQGYTNDSACAHCGTPTSRLTVSGWCYRCVGISEDKPRTFSDLLTSCWCVRSAVTGQRIPFFSEQAARQWVAHRGGVLLEPGAVKAVAA